MIKVNSAIRGQDKNLIKNKVEFRCKLLFSRRTNENRITKIDTQIWKKQKVNNDKIFKYFK